MKHTSVRAALEAVAAHPRPATDEVTQLPVHELCARTLYEIANNPDSSVRGASTRANKARKMILDRQVGKRRAGSHPATRNEQAVEFRDLTGKQVES